MVRYTRLTLTLRLALIAVGGVVVVATCLATLTPASLTSVGRGRWLALAIFTLLGVLAEKYPIRLGDDSSYVLSDAFIFAGTLLLPPGLVSLLCVTVGVAAALLDPREGRLFRTAFNTAVWLLGRRRPSPSSRRAARRAWPDPSTSCALWRPSPRTWRSST